jgi:hypothetical protein
MDEKEFKVIGFVIWVSTLGRYICMGRKERK